MATTVTTSQTCCKQLSQQYYLGNVQLELIELIGGVHWACVAVAKETVYLYTSTPNSQKAVFREVSRTPRNTPNQARSINQLQANLSRHCPAFSALFHLENLPFWADDKYRHVLVKWRELQQTLQTSKREGKFTVRRSAIWRSRTGLSGKKAVLLKNYRSFQQPILPSLRQLHTVTWTREILTIPFLTLSCLMSTVAQQNFSSFCHFFHFFSLFFTFFFTFFFTPFHQTIVFPKEEHYRERPNKPVYNTNTEHNQRAFFFGQNKSANLG